MKTKLLEAFTFIVIGILGWEHLIAQPKVSIYTEVGRNVVDNGLFVQSAGLAGYQFRSYQLETGCQFDLKSCQKNALSGFTMRFSKDLSFVRFPVSMQVMYVLKPLAGLLRETNWCVLSSIEFTHLKIMLGTDFRTFACTKSAIRELGLQSSNKIHEMWNMAYSISYYLKPSADHWNVALTLTDLDYFTIEHETNPVLDLKILVRLNLKILLFMDARYKCTWPCNLNMNALDVSFRAGFKFSIS